MMTPAHVIARVKDSSDLAALIAEYVPLKKQSSRMVGLCPFHKEDTPSFGVHAEGFYKCFGCQEGGDCFSFLQRIEGIPFHEALKRLAERAGISLDEKPVSRQAQRWAQDEAAFCRWYWERFRARQMAAIHGHMDTAEECWLDALGAPLRWLKGLSIPEQFAEFRKRATERDRAEWRAVVEEQREFAEMWMRLAG